MLGGILGVTLHYLRFGPEKCMIPMNEEREEQNGGQP